MNHIRKKLMGAALLSQCQKNAAENAQSFKTEEDGMGVIGVLGDMTNSTQLLSGVGLKGLTNLINTSDCSLNQSPIYLRTGSPAIEIELNDKNDSRCYRAYTQRTPKRHHSKKRNKLHRGCSFFRKS